MAYVCESLQVIESVNYGVNCVQSTGLMTPEVRDELLKWIIKVFAAAFVARKVVSMFR